jgi:hypothetical protein
MPDDHRAIVALETPYKGCRFRSRLEARWAVFYDHAGIQWSYENDPVTVAGENYLPDFKVTADGVEFIHEVKPESAKSLARPQHVFLAGKMDLEHDWRGLSSPLVVDRWGRTVTLDGTTWFVLAGPMSTGKPHMWDRHARDDWSTESYTEIALASWHMVATGSSIVCAHLNAPDCYGTLVEIRIAIGKGKLVSVTIDKELARSLSRGPGYDEDRPTHDLWFPCEMADNYAMVQDDEGARVAHGKFIRHHTAREYRLISTLALTGNQPAAMTFGDPLRVRERLEWKLLLLDWRTPIVDILERNITAAEHARAYRFAG